MRFGKLLTVVYWVLMVVATLAAASLTPAWATELEVLGEDSGNLPAVPVECDAGDVLVGFYARTGAWFDALSPECGYLDAKGNLTGGIYYKTPLLGDSGGSVQAQHCPAGQAVYYIQFTMFRQDSLADKGLTVTNLDDLLFRCRPIGSAGPDYANDPLVLMSSDDRVSISGANSKRPEIAGPDVNTGFSHNEECPSGEFGWGLQLDAIDASDGYGGVHRLGLICKVAKPKTAEATKPASPLDKLGKGKPSDLKTTANANGLNACADANAAAKPFLGRWTVTSMPSGVQFPMTLNVDSCGTVAGGYTMSDGPGKVKNGTVKNAVLSFAWTQGSYSGTGTFKVSGESLSGSWTFSNGLAGTWSAVPR